MTTPAGDNDTQPKVIRAIVTALETVVGPGRVLRGRYGSPPGGEVPFAAVSGVTETSEPAPPRYWTRTASVDLDLWIGAGDVLADERTWVAERLARDARNALEVARADRTNPIFLLDTWRVESVALGADLDVVPEGYARTVLVVEFIYREQGS